MLYAAPNTIHYSDLRKASDRLHLHYLCVYQVSLQLLWRPVFPFFWNPGVTDIFCIKRRIQQRTTTHCPCCAANAHVEFRASCPGTKGCVSSHCTNLGTRRTTKHSANVIPFACWVGGVLLAVMRIDRNTTDLHYGAFVRAPAGRLPFRAVATCGLCIHCLTLHRVN